MVGRQLEASQVSKTARPGAPKPVIDVTDDGGTSSHVHVHVHTRCNGNLAAAATVTTPIVKLYFFLLGSSLGFTYTNSTGDIPWT